MMFDNITNTEGEMRPIRPFSLEYEDAKNKVFDSINDAMKEHNIPLCLMETILSDAMREVKELARNQRECENVKYQKRMEEYCRNQEEKNKREVDANDG